MSEADNDFKEMEKMEIETLEEENEILKGNFERARADIILYLKQEEELKSEIAKLRKENEAVKRVVQAARDMFKEGFEFDEGLQLKDAIEMLDAISHEKREQQG